MRRLSSCRRRLAATERAAGAAAPAPALDRLTAWLGIAAGWLYVLAGAMIVWEVLARYLFVAPTIWSEELSRLALVWGTFLPMAALLRRRADIRITLITERLGPRGQLLSWVFSLLFIAAFSALVAWYGWDIAYDSWQVGRTSGTMMNIPNWWGEAIVPASFALLAVQCVVELLRLACGAAPAAEGKALE